MVLLKQENHGVNGYQLPATPRAARSSRKRCPFKKRFEDNRMCAFDLLASVARKLLHENGRSTPPNISSEENCNVAVKGNLKRDRRDESQSLKFETCDQGSRKHLVVDSELSSQALDRNNSAPEPPSFGNSSHSDCSEGYDDHMLVGGEVKTEVGSFLCKVEVGPSVSRGPVCFNKSEDENKGLKNEDEDMAHKVLMVEQVNLCHREETIVWDEKSQAQISSDCSANAATCRDHSPHRCVSAIQFDGVNFVSRDDDENFLGCTHPSTTKKSLQPGPRIGDRRIRKILASKYWKVSPKLNKVSLSSSDEAFNPPCCERNSGWKRLRSERNFPIKKRKSFHYSSVSSSGDGIISDGTSNSPEKDINEEASASYLKLHRVSGATSSVAKKVKLRIKSFKVPELFVEIPETATVGSLKSTVVDALSTILGGGLGIGVLLHGKKVKDDNKTLLQTGISRGNQLDSLGFSLEPSSFRTSQCSNPVKSSSMLSHEVPQPLNRIPANRSVIHGKTSVTTEEQQVPDLINFSERVHENAFAPDMSSNKCAADSKALVAVPAMSLEALAVVPAHRKHKQAEFAQRRIRRPFSVAEVEALVQAVEKIGTGRWRDVKVSAFDDAKHRTYVDLKDKWKTLVHTARISPQQRRGEPVPQELLDRVLRAHAYWSEQQAKQQLKQQSETRLLL